MKQGIHPDWHIDTKVACACGNSFITGSILPEIRVEICSACHPFFTGQQKFVDTLGQVERFQKRQTEAKAKQIERKKILESKKVQKEESRKDKPTLRDLLMLARKQANS